MLQAKENRAYLILVSIVICGIAASTITAPKLVHVGIDFPFSNLVFSVMTYPIVDCICELWGKCVARQTVYLTLCAQVIIVFILQLSIIIPPAPGWPYQDQYQLVMSASNSVVCASLLAFLSSQILDIMVYQRIKIASHGKYLWLRSNISTLLGQCADSAIFISIVFYHATNKLDILLGSVIVKGILSIAMTPVVYVIVIFTHRYCEEKTLAFDKRH